jgi:hypothetical protein
MRARICARRFAQSSGVFTDWIVLFESTNVNKLVIGSLTDGSAACVVTTTSSAKLPAKNER